MITTMTISTHYHAQVCSNESVFGTIIGTKRYYTRNIIAEKNMVSQCINFLCAFPGFQIIILYRTQTYIPYSTEHNDLQLPASYCMVIIPMGSAFIYIPLPNTQETSCNADTHDHYFPGFLSIYIYNIWFKAVMTLNNIHFWLIIIALKIVF